MADAEREKEKEDSHMLGGLKQLRIQIMKQNTVNISKIFKRRVWCDPGKKCSIFKGMLTFYRECWGC